MYTKHCRICGADIGFHGWGSHVRKEKRLHGEEVYRLHKDKAKSIKLVDSVNRKLSDFQNKKEDGLPPTAKAVGIRPTIL